MSDRSEWTKEVAEAAMKRAEELRVSCLPQHAQLSDL